jgi:hypothetical protein
MLHQQATQIASPFGPRATTATLLAVSITARLDYDEGGGDPEL